MFMFSEDLPSGVSTVASAIAEDLGRGQQAVRNQLAAARLISRQPLVGVSDEQLKGLVAGYVREELSIRERPDELDLAPSTVRNALLYAGVRLHPQGAQQSRR